MGVSGEPPTASAASPFKPPLALFLSLVFLGVSLSYVVGLPMGTWLASLQSWRLPIQVVAAASVVMLFILMLRLPARMQAPGATFHGAGALVRQPEVGLTLLLTLLYFTAIFTLFAYIGPMLQALGPLSVAQVSFTLLAIGVSGIVGTLIGGWATDRFGPVKTLRVQMAVFLLAQTAVPFSGGHYAITLAALLVWGVAGFGMMPPQQSRLAAASPANAPLLLSLNSSMLYLGTALGSIFGGLASTQMGFGQIAWAGVPLLVAGLVLLRKPTA